MQKIIYQLTQDGRLLTVADGNLDDFESMEVGEKRPCHEGTFDDGSYWERVQ